MKTIAVIDIGKTNAKVALVDLDRFEETAVRKTANGVVSEGLYPHFDVERLWRFITESLAVLNTEASIDAISVTTHGATAVLLDRNGDLALPLLDYEFSGPDTLAGDYDKVRPHFAETGSARLPGGLNIGAQIYWQEQTFPVSSPMSPASLPMRSHWSYRLTGVLSTELTSLGCHTDLWNPYSAGFSTMVDARGWRSLFAPVRRASDDAGWTDVASSQGHWPAVGAAGLLRHSRFKLLATTACFDAGSTFLRRFHWNLGGDDGDGRREGGAGRGARHADQRQCARRSRPIGAVHGRPGILDAGPRSGGGGFRGSRDESDSRRVDAAAIGAGRLRPISACKAAMDL